MRRSVLGLLVSSVVLASAPLGAQQPKPPSGPLAEGLAALNASDYAKAEAELGKVKGQPEAEWGLGKSALQQGKFDEAEKHALLAGTKGKVLRAEILLARGKQKEAIAVLDSIKKDKSPEGRRARLLIGDTLIAMGKRKDAEDPLLKVIEDYNDGSIVATDAVGFADVGRAAFLLRHPKDANQAFKESEKADKKRVETLLWEAELFLDKYDPGHAAEVTKEALEIAPKNPDVIVMMARVKLEQTMDFDDANKLVKEALAVNPHHAGAFAVQAGLALRDMDIKSTDKSIADGLSNDPSNLELLSLKAAARFLDDDKAGFESAKKTVFAQNSEFGRFYGIVGEYAEWEHRYDDIIQMQKEATKIDPDDGKAWAELGLTQMRSGDEAEGLKAIQKAWSKDKFNVRVFNTLNMYEKSIPTEYDLVDDGVFKIRYQKNERPVLERYVPRMLGEAWASMKSRYGFVPKVPVQVEMYSNREHFSVRTSGLPNIGIQGVCFGGMIAAISPQAEPFNWGNVVWHELGHVFAIQLSKNHVPRWFTEGLSEYETIARRPEWARELDPELYKAITENKLPGAVDMNRAFTHANDASDVTTAYYAASQMLIWTVERFGMKSVAKALELWGAGKKTPEVIQQAFLVSPADYDKGYREWQLARLSRYKNQYVFARKPQDIDDARRALKNAPNDPGAHVDLAMALLRSRGKPQDKGEDPKKELDAALSIDPKFADAHFVSAKLALGKKDMATAVKHLDTMRASGNDGFVVHMMLADISEAKEDKAQTRFHLEAAHRLDPSQSEPLKGLYDIAHEAKNAADELVLLRELAQLEQHDKKVWRMLLEHLVAAKQWDEARKVGDSAVYVDVTGGPTHVLYAKVLSQQGAHEASAYELESALVCQAKDNAERAGQHVLLAQEYATLGKKADAQKHKDEALKLDPGNADAKALKI